MKIVKRYQQVRGSPKTPKQCARSLTPFPSQWHVTKESREQGASLGFPMMEYDGAAELHFATLEDYKACLKLPRWEAIFKDEEKFIDLPIHTMYGYEYLVIGQPLVYNEPDHQVLP
jgi:hypothetical protein